MLGETQQHPAMDSNQTDRSSEFSVVIIGGGSAGFAAACAALKETDSVAVIEGGSEVGGLCILRGCMPTKALLESSHRMHEAGRAREFGIAGCHPRAMPATVLRRKNQLVSEFASYRRGQLQRGCFTFIRGLAKFGGPNELLVQPVSRTGKPRAGSPPRRIRFQRCVIATGSQVAWPSIPGLCDGGCMTSDDAIALARLPKSMIVLGGGSVACELAQHFARLGCRITLIQRSPHVLSDMDTELGATIEEQFTAEGIRVFTGTHVLNVARSGRSRRVTFRHGRRTVTVAAESILSALGRRPAIDSLDLQAADIRVERNAIVVDDSLRTSQPNVFAAGDCNGLVEVVHIAVQQGEIAGANAANGASATWDRRLKAHVVFTEPQIAACGHSERELVGTARPFLAASYPFADHGKSMIHGSTRGFVRIFCDPSTGEILGGCIAGPHAGELIHELIAAMHWHGTVAQLAAMPHYHPTLAEIITYPAEELAKKVEMLRKSVP